MSKNDMKNHVSTLSKSDLKDLVKTFRIPLDLHPRLPDSTFTMDRLPSDAIGVYSEFLRFSGIRIPFSTFLLSVLKYFRDICMDDGPSSLKKWKKKFFLIDRRAILDHLTWIHSYSCVLDDLPVDGYNRNDMERLRVHLIRLRETREEVLVRSGLNFDWSNKECDMVFQRNDDNSEMSFYDFMTLPSWGDAKIVEEPHHLSTPLLEHVPSHIIALATEDALIQLPTPDEVAAAQPDLRLARKSKGPSQRRLKKIASKAGSSAPELGQAKGLNEAGITNLCVELEDSIERDEGTSIRAASVLHHVLMDPLDALARSALSRDAEYDEIPKDDFCTATRSEEIELTLFPLAPGPYQISYPYEGISSPLYTKEEWDEFHASESNTLCKDIFKDPDVCRKALDWTITPTELRRTESLLPLELSNRVNVLSALLVSHGYELNSRYTNLDASRVRLQEKLDQKKGDVNMLRLEVTSLDNKLEKVQRDCDALGQENKV
ncbi:hypothetical protein Tco_0823546 [Tanacetum coccineum]|uniref:Uncharacterized protein n=1 Tax=Tanacetum coccineum TaxID=301880 RepID=A0ABQ5AL80_9ASTR